VLAEAIGPLAAVAATAGPGLIGGLLVGRLVGKGIAAALRCRPGVNTWSPRADRRAAGGASGAVAFRTPAAAVGRALPVRGGGGRRAARRSAPRWTTRWGEAFDKSAKLLGLPWPGGRHWSGWRLAAIPRASRLPRPLLGPAGLRLLLQRPEDGGGAWCREGRP
jgi:N6-L-threonylcarbamoyladenine synthase